MANTTISVTENLMNLSRMMSSQVKQSEQTMETLGTVTVSIHVIAVCGNFRYSNSVDSRNSRRWTLRYDNSVTSYSRIRHDSVIFPVIGPSVLSAVNQNA